MTLYDFYSSYRSPWSYSWVALDSTGQLECLARFFDLDLYWKCPATHGARRSRLEGVVIGDLSTRYLTCCYLGRIDGVGSRERSDLSPCRVCGRLLCFSCDLQLLGELLWHFCWSKDLFQLHSVWKPLAKLLARYLEERGFTNLQMCDQSTSLCD